MCQLIPLTEANKIVQITITFFVYCKSVYVIFSWKELDILRLGTPYCVTVEGDPWPHGMPPVGRLSRPT